MAAVTIGVTGATWGLTAETGILVQTVSQKTSRQKNEVRNNTGDVVLVSYYNQTSEYAIAGVLTGITGIAAASPGAALTVANQSTIGQGAVTAGHIYTNDVDVQGASTEFQKITVNATQYPLITNP